MSNQIEEFAATLRARLSHTAQSVTVHKRQVTLEVLADDLIGVAGTLRDDAEFHFEQLIDLCGVDYLHYGQVEWQTSDEATTSGFSRGVDRNVPNKAPAEGRFAVVYQLLSITHNRRLRVRAMTVGDPPRIPSVVPLWNGANWFEREAFDLFGILFEGHPDLRRLLTDYGFVGYPFRKDFPLIGEVEMRYDPQKRRVVYEPVSIEPRTLVPRAIRHDARYADAETSSAAADEEPRDA